MQDVEYIMLNLHADHRENAIKCMSEDINEEMWDNRLQTKDCGAFVSMKARVKFVQTRI